MITNDSETIPIDMKITNYLHNKNLLEISI